ncbi:MAG: mechanosensitive ion channel [Lachnospiraceae bacterium]|nr:mechanosensitive ion channel [Lachnospiraceae bacterium]
MEKKEKVKIINPTRKFVGGFLLGAILCGILWVIILFMNILSTQNFKYAMQTLQQDEQTGNKPDDTRFEGIVNAGEEIARNLDEAMEEYYEQCQCKADLTARASYETVTRLGDDAIGKLGKGAIVKAENGVVTISDGIRSGICKYPQMADSAKGMFDYMTSTSDGSRRDVLFFSRIKGPYYYVEIINGRDMLEYLDKYVNYDEMLSAIEMAYSVYIFIVCPDRENSRFFYNLNGNLVYYYGKAFLDNGILTENAEDYGLPSDRAGLLALNGKMFASDEGEMSYVVREVQGLESILVIQTTSSDAVRQAIEETHAGIQVIMVLLLTFLVWITSVYGEMTRGLITDKKKERYSPERIRLIALSCGVLGAIIVFGTSVFFRSLNSIYIQINNNQGMLSVIDVELENNKEYLEKRKNARQTLYLEYARRAAQLIEKEPRLNNKEELEAINRIIGSEYIILFDSEGKETGCSTDYINMELGRDDVDHPVSSADFRRLLKGVPGIAHSAFKDEVTGRKLEQYGVRMKDPKTGGYGALIIAVKPKEQTDQEEMDLQVLRGLTPQGMFSFIIDMSKVDVRSSTSEDFMYMYYTGDLGLSKSMLTDGVADFARIGGLKYFCTSKKMSNGDIIYLCTPNDMVFSKGIRYGLICAVGFLMVFALVFLYMSIGYNRKMIEKVRQQNEKPDQKAPEDGEAGKKDSPANHSRLASVLTHIVGNATPERRASVAFEIMVALSFLRMFLTVRSGNAPQENLLLNYVLKGQWNRGLNIFSLTSIVMLLAVLALVVLFVRFFMNMLGRMLNSRGKTICRLISNLIIYICILVFIYYALSYLGVDTNAILASVGVIGIGVSMGARDLIADIFAGVSMIFEGEYQVGDIVNIDGYRGMVQEVGVRSTRLIGRGGNVKVIGNKDIKSVTNLTKMNSWVAITIKVDVNYSIRDAEEIISNTLPQIAAKHHEIISGPYYKGILSVEMGYAVLSIIAECYEDDYHKVERFLVREVLLALREKNVPVR